MKIHPAAIVSEKAKLGKGVEVGPFSIINEDVEIGENTKIHSSVVIDRFTTIGANCQIFPGAVIGTISQDRHFKEERSYVRIGDNNIIREYVTINRATGEEKATIIGSNNILMAYTHIAHNCIIDDEVTIANACGLSGHVHIEDQAVLGGMVGVHQFVRIGRLSMVGGYSKIAQDVPPYMMVDGRPARVFGLNTVGLKRRGVPVDIRADLKKAVKVIYYSDLNLTQALQEIKTQIKKSQEIDFFLSFFTEPSEKGVLLQKNEKDSTSYR